MCILSLAGRGTKGSFTGPVSAQRPKRQLRRRAMSCFQIKALSIWIVAVCFAEQVRSQTVQLASSQLRTVAARKGRL
jgi:hypothetical protein